MLCRRASWRSGAPPSTRGSGGEAARPEAAGTFQVCEGEMTSEGGLNDLAWWAGVWSRCWLWWGSADWLQSGSGVAMPSWENREFGLGLTANHDTKSDARRTNGHTANWEQISATASLLYGCIIQSLYMQITSWSARDSPAASDPSFGDFAQWSILALQERSPSYTIWKKKNKSFKQIEENNEATGFGFGKNVDQWLPLEVKLAEQWVWQLWWELLFSPSTLVESSCEPISTNLDSMALLEISDVIFSSIINTPHNTLNVTPRLENS